MKRRYIVEVEMEDNGDPSFHAFMEGYLLETISQADPGEVAGYMVKQWNVEVQPWTS